MSTFHIGLTANRITGVEKMVVLVIGARKSRVSISFVTFNTSFHHAPSVFLSRAFVIGKFLLWRRYVSHLKGTPNFEYYFQDGRTGEDT